MSLDVVQGLLSWDLYTEWSEAKLGKPLALHVDSRFQSKIIPRGARTGIPGPGVR